MKKKFIIYIVFFASASFLIYSKFTKSTPTVPKIILNGQHIVTINLNQKYEEAGFKAYDDNGDLTDKVEIKGKVLNKEGTYELVYFVTNKEGEIAKAHRFIKVIANNLPIYKNEYDDIDNTLRGWWSNNKKNGERPSGGADINELKKYDAFFMGPDEMTLYLTFDEGSNDTYLKEIVDVLNKNNVKATFFLCRKFIEDNATLIKQMDDMGHTIANHTSRHLSMPSLANKENFDKYLEEIVSVEDTYNKATGKQMEKIYREPRGEWSFRSLQIMKDLGYKTYFYSADYFDFGDDVTKEKALNELTIRAHRGAIYLMHPKNKGNYLALDSFINNMKKQGYKFDLVKNIE